MKRISHFRFSRSQRSGIFFLGVCILLLQVLIRSGVFEPPAVPPSGEEQEIARINAVMDSLEREGDTQYKPRPFDPNYMSDQKGYGFGMSPEAIDRLFRYRESGGYVRSAKAFQEVTGIHDSVLAVMAPYFQFPRFPKVFSPVRNAVSRYDINKAEVEHLIKVRGIGPVLAERILAYRERLGGFAVREQLEEVYGLSEEVLGELWRSFHLDDPVAYEKKNINSAGVSELAAVPYVSRSLAAKIVAYRSMHGSIDSIGELTKFHNLSQKDLDRIGLYLTVE